MTTQQLDETLSKQEAATHTTIPFTEPPKSSEDFSIEYGVWRVIGSRDYQQDEYTCIDNKSGSNGISFFGVFDGHGSDCYSSHASSFLHKMIVNGQILELGIEKTLTKAFMYEDKETLRTLKMDKQKKGGTTATICVITGNTLALANVGDSSAILCKKDESGEFKPFRISRDHKPDDPDERQRIENAGGIVIAGRVYGEDCAINMSRALGDHEFKAPLNFAQRDFISSEPYISPTFTIDHSFKFLVIASDGLWNTYSDNEVVDMVLEERKKGLTCEEISKKIAQKCGSQSLSDNTTVLIIFFKFHSIEKVPPPLSDSELISKHSCKTVVPF